MRGTRPTLKALDGGLHALPPVPADYPADMGKDWQTVTADLQRRGHLTSATLGIVDAYCTALWQIRAARKDLLAEGLTVRTKDGNPKPHPAVALMKAAQETVARLGAELGLTPSSRSRPGMEQKADNASADPTSEWDF